MRLRTRVEAGGTPRRTRWGVDSEYARLRDVLVAPIVRFEWRPGNAGPQRSARVGLEFDVDSDVSMIGDGGGAEHCICQALKQDSADGR